MHAVQMAAVEFFEKVNPPRSSPALKGTFPLNLKLMVNKSCSPFARPMANRFPYFFTDYLSGVVDM
jgi:hypothetical protein